MAVDRIKIAYILTPITFGGAEKVSLNFLRAVDRDRFDIHLILLTRPWEEPPYFAREIDKLGYSYDTVPVALKIPGVLKVGGDPLRLPRVAHRLYLILKRGTFDLVHTHGYFADICGLPVARLLGIASISTCHGFIANDLKLRVYNWVDKMALRLCRTVIVVSESIMFELGRRGINSSRLAFIPNAVSTPCGVTDLRASGEEKRCSLGISQQELVVGYLGRLSEEKGVKYLIEAIAKLREAACPVTLLIIGDGPERQTLEQKVRASGLESKVIFAGFKTDIENWIPTFDIFTLPSLTEGTPMALLEAMAFGVPVIATSVGGVPSVVTDGVNGLLVPPGNAQALSEKIQLLKDTPELKSKLVRAGAVTIKENYGVDKWCRKVERQYLGD